MMNLNGKQIMAIAGAVLSALVVSTAQLTDLFGPGIAKTIVSAAGMVNLVLQSITAAITGQGQMVKDVLAMPGVERIGVNKEANQTLAALAMDPMVNNIAPIRGAETAVQSAAQT